MSQTPKHPTRTDVTAAWTFAMPQQIEIFAAMNEFMAAWMKRRQEALDTGLEALRKMAASPDPATAGRICTDWMGGSMNRILADVSDARDQAGRMAEQGQRAYRTMLSDQAATMAAVGEQAKAQAAQVEAVAQQATSEPSWRRAA